jgi:hypothetical protein
VFSRCQTNFTWSALRAACRPWSPPLHILLIGRCGRLAFMRNVNPGYKLVNNGGYPQIAQDYELMFRVLNGLPCDVLLGAHGSYYGMEAKFARVNDAAANPFVDAAGSRAMWRSGRRLSRRSGRSGRANRLTEKTHHFFADFSRGMGSSERMQDGELYSPLQRQITTTARRSSRGISSGFSIGRRRGYRPLAGCFRVLPCRGALRCWRAIVPHCRRWARVCGRA